MKIAIIGCGDIVDRYYGPSFMKLRDERKVDERFCCDLDTIKAANFRRKYGFDRSFTDADRMIDETKPDCLFIATPVTVTTGMAIHLSTYRIPMMIEKPPALTLASGQKLNGALIQNSVLHQIAFNRHFMPVVQYLKNDLRERGKTIQCVHSLMSRYRRIENTFYTTAIHSIDLVRYLAGSEYRTISLSYQELPNYGNGVCNIFMDYVFENGVVGQASMLVCSGTTNERVMVTCDDATYFAHLPMWNCDDVPGLVQCNENNSLLFLKKGEDLDATDDYIINGFHHEISHFLSCVATGEQPEESMSYAMQSIHIAECISQRKSEFQNNRVDPVWKS
ncbi:MAG: Gfo/Idh/MocA family protein [Sphaerochaetaceae bacterium]